MRPHLTLVSNVAPSLRHDSLRIAIAATDPLARAGLMSILGAFDGLSIADTFSIDDRLESRVRVLAPDVVVVDLGTAGAAALDEIRQLDSPALVLIGNPSLATEAMAAGARGLLLRSASPRRVHAAIEAIAEGMTVVDEELSDGVLQHARPIGAALIEPLTNRELEVVQLLASGLTNKEIAHRLGISEHTVKFHVNGILGKLGVETRTEAVVHAARLGIVML